MSTDRHELGHIGIPHSLDVRQVPVVLVWRPYHCKQAPMTEADYRLQQHAVDDFPVFIEALRAILENRLLDSSS